MLNRKKDARKGDNGKVMIIGGSPTFHGAPILCSLGAEFSGADLVFPFLPPMHADTARAYSLNFIIHTYKEDVLSAPDVKTILNFSKKMDTVVIGPGLGTDTKTARAVKTLLAQLTVPTVVDASALVYTNSYPKNAVITPHRGEFTNLTGDDPTPKNVQKFAKQQKVTVLCKGPDDIIADSDNIAINETGNALMTVGGSGDVLSGLIGGLIAQGMNLFDAAQYGARLIGQAGEGLAQTQGSLRAIDLANALPQLLKKD